MFDPQVVVLSLVEVRGCARCTGRDQRHACHIHALFVTSPPLDTRILASCNNNKHSMCTYSTSTYIYIHMDNSFHAPPELRRLDPEDLQDAKHPYESRDKGKYAHLTKLRRSTVQDLQASNPMTSLRFP